RTPLFGTRIETIDTLEPSTKYYYRFRFGGIIDTTIGRFRTFPTEGSVGPLKIVVGSCNYTPNPELFSRIKNLDPDLFIHLGDWNWPPAQFGNDMMLYPSKQSASFASRYRDESMRTSIMPYTPVDYVYDDDFSWNDGEGWTYPTFTVSVDSNGSAQTQLYTNPMPAGIREGAIQAYFNYFPAYPPVDTSAGIYHSFIIGNVEFLMLDLRNNRQPRHEAFHYDSLTGLWSYQPAPHHTMMGETQRAWLIYKLTHPQTDWTVIGSSIVFNKNYDTILNVGIGLQHVALNIAGGLNSGLVLASQMSYCWDGYPYDQDTILKMAQQGIVKNTVVISGDSHSSMIDDGTNAGLPELSSSGMAANDEGTINYYFDQYTPLLGFGHIGNILWNGGGSGIFNNDTLDSYGTIDVFGKDSMRLCVFDKHGVQLGCTTILHNDGISAINYLGGNLPIKTYPNPGQGLLVLETSLDDYNLVITDILGRVEYQSPHNSRKISLNIQKLSPGLKIISVKDNANPSVTGYARWVKL
ncbi:MAG TPA: alkaline phosphatase D family protein, partial [Chitinophagales bacterium]|nr:alkaline phosphatase D family protein [Chitinophagales bacterium]